MHDLTEVTATVEQPEYWLDIDTNEWWRWNEQDRCWDLLS